MIKSSILISRSSGLIGPSKPAKLHFILDAPALPLLAVLAWQHLWKSRMLEELDCRMVRGIWWWGGKTIDVALKIILLSKEKDSNSTSRTTHHLLNKLRPNPLVIQRCKVGVLDLQTYQNPLRVLDHVLVLGFPWVVKFVFQCAQLCSLLLCILLHILGLVSSLMYLGYAW